MVNESENGNSLRAVIDIPDGGRCMMAGFPGLATGIDGTAYMDPEGITATLGAIRDHGAPLLVILTEESELPDDAYTLVRKNAEEIGLHLAFLPIVDFSVPAPDMLERWYDLQAKRDDLPNSGGTVAFCCQHGAGRSGLMAALVLLNAHVPLDTAVTTVRGQFSEAIESAAQMEWLKAVSARLKDQPGALDLDSDPTHS